MSSTRHLTHLALPKNSLDGLPNRPPLSRTKQVPGRYFPKPTTPESVKVISFSIYRRYKPPVRLRSTNTGNSRSLNTNNIPVESLSFVDVVPRPDRQLSPEFRRPHPRSRPPHHTEFLQDKRDIFAISFNMHNENCKDFTEGHRPDIDLCHNTSNGGKHLASAFSCKSVLRSDYYTIKRLSVNTWPAKSANVASSTTATDKRFSVVLRGQPKQIHPKILFLDEEEQREGLAESCPSGHLHINIMRDHSPEVQPQVVEYDVGD